jgi:hypothetical protein
MELSKINKIIKLTLNPTIVLGYSSPTASNEEAITTLMKKDKESGKEKTENRKKTNSKKIWRYHKKMMK